MELVRGREYGSREGVRSAQEAKYHGTAGDLDLFSFPLLLACFLQLYKATLKRAPNPRKTTHATPCAKTQAMQRKPDFRTLQIKRILLSFHHTNTTHYLRIKAKKITFDKSSFLDDLSLCFPTYAISLNAERSKAKNLVLPAENCTNQSRPNQRYEPILRRTSLGTLSLTMRERFFSTRLGFTVCVTGDGDGRAAAIGVAGRGLRPVAILRMCPDEGAGAGEAERVLLEEALADGACLWVGAAGGSAVLGAAESLGRGVLLPFVDFSGRGVLLIRKVCGCGRGVRCAGLEVEPGRGCRAPGDAFGPGPGDGR